MSYMIVSRDFWPNAASIGEGLNLLARGLSENAKTSVVTMSNCDIKALNSEKFGPNRQLSFFVAKPLTNSSSMLVVRVFELIYFGFWLLISLARARPNVVYVATNPPIFVPLVVGIYCRLFGKRFVYHVQDIHPEAANLLLPLPSAIFTFLRRVDSWTLKAASKVITLSPEMQFVLEGRGVEANKIFLLDNPSVVHDRIPKKRRNGVVFAGNAGRLQIMDVVLDAIDEYLSLGGSLEFCFIGAGVYKNRIIGLANLYEEFSYKGYVTAKEALEISSGYQWGLLPILPAVLDFAYPSKIPSYLSAGCGIISVTNGDSSLAKWIISNQVGFNVEPSKIQLINCFKRLENAKESPSFKQTNASCLFSSPNVFADALQKQITDLV